MAAIAPEGGKGSMTLKVRFLTTRHYIYQFTKYKIISFEDSYFWPKIYLISYPSFQNSTTHITMPSIYKREIPTAFSARLPIFVSRSRVYSTDTGTEPASHLNVYPRPAWHHRRTEEGWITYLKEKILTFYDFGILYIKENDWKIGEKKDFAVCEVEKC